jgi:3-hydroxyisobutyrate dehydrogenase-like beta-hydroxyacid dehydrogenase
MTPDIMHDEQHRDEAPGALRIDETRPRVGFIGMGGMGSRMASRLLGAGYGVTVYNRARSRTHPLEQRGAKVAGEPATLAAGADIVFSSVADDAAVVSVLAGRGGAFTAARPGTIFVDMSTVAPATSRSLHEAAARQGMAFLDAPVSGTTSIAEQGKLVVFVGGEQSVYERWKPILGVLGRESFYMGPAGSGAMMKLCVNTVLGVGMQALAEALALGLKGGLERDRLLDVIGRTAVVSPSQISKLRNAGSGAYPPEFPLRLMLKDFRLIAETAMHLSAAMPGTAAALRTCSVEFDRQSAAGRDEDFSSIIRAMEHMARDSTDASVADGLVV